MNNDSLDSLITQFREEQLPIWLSKKDVEKKDLYHLYIFLMKKSKESSLFVKRLIDRSLFEKDSERYSYYSYKTIREICMTKENTSRIIDICNTTLKLDKSEQLVLSTMIGFITKGDFVEPTTINNYIANLTINFIVDELDSITYLRMIDKRDSTTLTSKIKKIVKDYLNYLNDYVDLDVAKVKESPFTLLLNHLMYEDILLTKNINLLDDFTSLCDKVFLKDEYMMMN